MVWTILQAFQQIYDGVKAPATRADTTPLHWMVDLYWETVSKEFAGHPAVLAYEVSPLLDAFDISPPPPR